MQAINLLVEKINFILLGLYRPPSTNTDTFLEELSDILDAVNLTDRHPIILGDVNCPGSKPDDIDHRLSALLTCYGLAVVNPEPTHLHSDGGQSKLDLVIKSDDFHHLTYRWTRPVRFSDHSLESVHLKRIKPSPAVGTYMYRDFRRMDTEAFRRNLRKSQSFCSPPMNPDTSASQLNADLSTALDRHAPLKTRTRRIGKFSLTMVIVWSYRGTRGTKTT